MLKQPTNDVNNDSDNNNNNDSDNDKEDDVVVHQFGVGEVEAAGDAELVD